MKDEEVIKEMHSSLVQFVNEEVEINLKTNIPASSKLCKPKPPPTMEQIPPLTHELEGFGPDFYLKCCFFVTCIVARVFLMQCVLAKDIF